VESVGGFGGAYGTRAPPLRAGMTRGPVVGAAGFVDSADRKRSATLPIAYDHEQKRLDLPGHGATA